MRRLSFVGFFVLFVLIICGVYRVANQYQVYERQVAQMNSDMEEEHENIRVLQAEWAFLTSPSRLEKIARENFQLQPVDGRQMVAVANIPVRAAMDAQEVKSDVAGNNQDDDKTVATTAKPVAPVKSLPPGVVPVQNNDETATIASAAMPAAVTQSLPPIEATPVSAQVAR